MKTKSLIVALAVAIFADNEFAEEQAVRLIIDTPDILTGLILNHSYDDKKRIIEFMETLD